MPTGASSVMPTWTATSSLSAQAHWRARFAHPLPGQFGFVALLGIIPAAFAFAIPHVDPCWGTHLDNLHVRPGLRGDGIGTRLLHAVTSHVLVHHPGEGLFLWVFELNTRTRAYYERLGGQEVEREVIPAPGGGTVSHCRCVWPDIEILHAATRVIETER